MTAGSISDCLTLKLHQWMSSLLLNNIKKNINDIFSNHLVATECKFIIAMMHTYDFGCTGILNVSYSYLWYRTASSSRDNADKSRGMITVSLFFTCLMNAVSMKSSGRHVISFRSSVWSGVSTFFVICTNRILPCTKSLHRYGLVGRKFKYACIKTARSARI